MQPVSARFLAALQGSHNIAVKLEVMEPNTSQPILTIKQSGVTAPNLLAPRILDGSVTMDRNADRRTTFTAKLVDPTFSIVPQILSTDPLAPYGNWVRLYRGIAFSDTPGDEEYVRLGTFRLTDVNLSDSAGGLEIDIAGEDLSRIVARNVAILYYQVGVVPGTGIVQPTLFTDTIRQILQSQYPAVVFNDDAATWATLQNDPTVMTPPAAPAPYSEGTDLWKVSRDFASAVGCELYFDRNGVCTLIHDPAWTAFYGGTIPQPVYSFVEGPSAVFSDLHRNLTDNDTWNYVVVTGVGNNLTGNVLRSAAATDTDPNSPTFASPTSQYGLVPHFESNQIIFTQAQADNYAQHLLAQHLGAQENVQLSAFDNPALDVDDVISVTRERVGLFNIQYIIDSLTIPLMASNLMTVKMRERRALNSAGTAERGGEPATAPSPPAISLQCTVSEGAATVLFQPGDDGGDPNVTYLATAFTEPGHGATGLTAINTVSPIIINRLVNDTSYSFNVIAINSIGVSLPSDYSNTVTPTAALAGPNVPTNVSATVEDQATHVTWTVTDALATSFLIKVYTGAGGAHQPSLDVTVDSPPMPGLLPGTVVQGLTNGSPGYQYTVTAINAAGTTAESAKSASVIPGEIPEPPVVDPATSATPGSTSASIAFTPNADNGGYPVTLFTCYIYYVVAGLPVFFTKKTGSSSPITVAGLDPNQTYQFAITATNARGESLHSGLSNPISPLPSLVPSIPTNVFMSQADLSSVVTFRLMPPYTPPAPNQIATYMQSIFSGWVHSGIVVTAQVSNNVLADSVLVAFIERDSSLFTHVPTVQTVTDDQGGCWKQIAEGLVSVSNDRGFDVWVCEHPKSGVKPLVTATLCNFPAVAIADMGMLVVEYGNAAGYGIIDQVGFAEIDATSGTVTTPSSCLPHDIICTLVVGNMTAVTAPAGFTIRTTPQYFGFNLMAVADNIDSGVAGIQSATWTGMTGMSRGYAVIFTLRPGGKVAFNDPYRRQMQYYAPGFTFNAAITTATCPRLEQAPLAGSTLIAVVVPNGDAELITLTDDVGNTWVGPFDGGNDTIGMIHPTLWYSLNVAASPPKLSGTLSTPQPDGLAAWTILEYPNLFITGTPVVTRSLMYAATTSPSLSITPARGHFVLCYVNGENGFFDNLAPTIGWRPILMDSNGSAGLAEIVNASGAPITAGWSYSASQQGSMFTVDFVINLPGGNS